MVKISVIVPVYNMELYLKRCLDSLVAQTIDNYEVIIVNDGSNDQSQKIIDYYLKKHPGIVKSYQKENGGLSDARNFGLEKAKGDFISFVDSDDWIDNNMLKLMYEKANKNNLDIVVCDFINFYDNKKQYVVKARRFTTNNVVKDYFVSPPMACNKIYRKFLFNDNRFKKNIIYEDLELIPTLSISTINIDFIDEPLYYYYQRQGSIMNQLKFNKNILNIFEVLNSIRNKCTISNTDIFFKNEIEYLYIEHLLRSASLRFSSTKNSLENVKRISSLIKTEFPNWFSNPYFKKRGTSFKIICLVAINNNIFFLRQIGKVMKILR